MPRSSTEALDTKNLKITYTQPPAPVRVGQPKWAPTLPSQEMNPYYMFESGPVDRHFNFRFKKWLLFPALLHVRTLRACAACSTSTSRSSCVL